MLDIDTLPTIARNRFCSLGTVLGAGPPEFGGFGHFGLFGQCAQLDRLAQEAPLCKAI